MEQAFAMAVFALAMSISPGPVNLITLSAGLNHGARSALRFVAGATIGFTLLLFLIGSGLSAITDRLPWFVETLTVFGAALIVYFGYKLVTSDGGGDSVCSAKPTFWQGVALQWLNPKAWGACIAAVGLFELDKSQALLNSFVILYCVICFIGIGSWAAFGHQVKQLLSTPRRRVLFNQALGVVLMFLAVFLLLQLYQN